MTSKISQVLIVSEQNMKKYTYFELDRLDRLFINTTSCSHGLNYIIKQTYSIVNNTVKQGS